MLTSRRPKQGSFRAAASAALAAVLLLVDCACVVATTYVHRTLEGQPFAVERLTELHPGLAAQDVTTLLGQPLMRRQDGDRIVWRYFEHAYPKWCDGGNRHQARPEYRVEAVLFFREGRLERSEIARNGI